MNIAKAIEQTLTTMLRNYAEMGDNTQIRPWQSLDEDDKFDPDNDRSFPAVDVRFAAPRYNEDQSTLVCMGGITAMTYTNDDVSHQTASTIFDSLFGVALSLFRDSLGREAVDDAGKFAELQEGVAALTENSQAVSIGGITLEEGVPPSEGNPTTEIGVGIGVHFAYT